MQAICLRELGPPENLRYEELDDLSAGKVVLVPDPVADGPGSVRS